MAESKLNFNEKLLRVQAELKAPKDKDNTFGRYKYRSAESILEAVKPLLDKYQLVMRISDDIVYIGDRFYIKSVVTITDAVSGIGVAEVSAFAREEDTKKGMDASQITGTASSYARKYALNGLFLIDDTKDTDTDEYATETKNRKEYAEKKEKEESKPEPLATSRQIEIIKKIGEELGYKEFDEEKVKKWTAKGASNFIARYEKEKKEGK